MIIGCMFSGKSSELMRRAKRHMAIGRNVLIVNHVFDNRCADNEVKAHSGENMQAIKINRIADMKNTDEYDVIAIDEGQFFQDLPSVMKLIQQKKRVIVAGLSSDFMRRPFDNISAMIAHADDVVFMKALCIHCGADAVFSKRTSNESSAICVGGASKYDAVCRTHYET